VVDESPQKPIKCTNFLSVYLVPVGIAVSVLSFYESAPR